MCVATCTLCLVGVLGSLLCGFGCNAQVCIVPISGRYKLSVVRNHFVDLVCLILIPLPEMAVAGVERPRETKGWTRKPCTKEFMVLYHARTSISISDGTTVDFWHSPWIMGCQPRDIVLDIFYTCKIKSGPSLMIFMMMLR